MAKEHVIIKNISKIYPDGTKALHDINLVIEEGEIVVLLGSSGCGKSTLLRIIGGLEKKTSGEVFFYDKEISGVPVEKRDIGFVFQNYALFPTMTVKDNIRFGMKLRKMSAADMDARLDHLLDLMNLREYADKKLGQLSGGQQQRVAIARVLAIQPTVLLMDEPLTALDAKLKDRLRVDLSLMLRQLGITTIYVTHDQAEAMAIADRIAIMNKGVIEQIDTPENIYTKPATDFVAQFIGKINKFTGQIVKEADRWTVDLGFARVTYNGKAEPEAGKEITVFLRPEDMSIADEGVVATVEQCAFMGDYCRIAAELDGQKIFFEASNTVKLESNEKIHLNIQYEKMMMM